MASLLFPDAGSRRAEDTAGRPAVAKTAIVYADSAGATAAEIYTDTAGVPGTLISGGTLTTDAYGFLPLFWGPASGVDKLYVSVNGGPIWPINADYDTRVDALTDRIVSLEAGGGGEGGDGSAAAVAAHEADTTNVHGIANTALLETTAGAQAKADAAQAAAVAVAQATALQKASNLADLPSAATARTSLGLAAAAVLDVGTGVGTVAAGDDSRLSDARTPTAHAASHVAAGTDPLTLAQSQITGLTSTLTAKADLVGGVVPSSQLPDLVINATFTVESEAEMLALAASVGDLAIRIDLDPAEVFILTVADPEVLGNWVELNLAGSVVSVNGQSGAVTLAATDIGAVPTARTITAGTGLTGGGDLSANHSFAVTYGTTTGTATQGDDTRVTGAAQKTANLSDLANAASARSNLGLGNVTNTADADKPVSSAQQAALNLKAPVASPTFTGTVAGITKTMVGLGNVDNTTDAAKPISTAAQAALDAKVSEGALVYNVNDYGADPTGVADSLAAFNLAMTAAGGGIVYVPPGTYLLTATPTLSGKTCSLRGSGSATILRGTGAGPVLDFTGWPGSGKTVGNFAVEGNNTAGSTSNTGIKLTAASSQVGMMFHDIRISKTGGPGFDFGQAELADFNRIMVTEPVGAAANDVPYFTAAGACNGNRMRGCALFSTSLVANIGASGAVVFKDNGSFAPHNNLLDGWWIQTLHPSTGQTIFAIAGNGNVLQDLQFFDCSKVSGATGTAYVRFSVPAVSDLGGNIVRGEIPGKDPGVPTTLDCGVDMLQSRNRVEGTKGYRGTNVILASGVANTFVMIGGSMGQGLDATVVDNSGSTSNVVIDSFLNDWRFGTAAAFRFGATGPSIRAGSATPEGSVSASVGSLYLRSGGGAATSLYVKESGSSTTGWRGHAAFLDGSATLDFGSIAAGAVAELTVTVTGATAGDLVLLGPPATLEAGLVASARVSATDTVTVRLHNPTAGAVDPASAAWKVRVGK